MTKGKRNPKVDFFFKTAKAWREEFVQLRNIVLDCPLSEELKWGKPCYTTPAKTGSEDANVVIIHGFKEYARCYFPRVKLQPAISASFCVGWLVKLMVAAVAVSLILG